VERAFEEFDGGPARDDGGPVRDGKGRLGEVCAIALPDDSLGHIVALIIEPVSAGLASDGWSTSECGPRNSGTPDKAELLAHARAQLAPQFVPRRFYLLDRLPRTVGGKIRRNETVDLVMSGKAQRL